MLPWIWLPMIFLSVRGFRWQALWTHRLLVWLAAPPILGFALVSVWSGQRVLYHWAAPGYLMLFPLLGEAIATLRDRAWVRRVVAGAPAVLVLASVTVISTQIQFDWLGRSLATIMHRDPTQEAVDWTTLGDDLRSRGLLPAGTVAAAVSWRDAGKIGYGLGSGVTMLCLCVELQTVRLRASAGRFRRTDIEFTNGDTRQSLGLTGFETFDVVGLDANLKPRATLTVRATAKDGSRKEFKTLARIDTPEEMHYYKNGGILPYVLRQLVSGR